MGSDGMDEVDLAVDDWKCDEGLVERQDTGGMLGPNEDAVDLESVSSLLLSVLFNGVARSGRMRAGQAGRNSQYDIARGTDWPKIPDNPPEWLLPTDWAWAGVEDGCDLDELARKVELRRYRMV